MPINENKSEATAINFTRRGLLSAFNDAQARRPEGEGWGGGEGGEGEREGLEHFLESLRMVEKTY